MTKYPTQRELPIQGGWLCLDFANTIYNRKSRISEDYLSSYHSILTWTRKVNCLEDDEIGVLSRLAKMNPGMAEAGQIEIQMARESLFMIFQSITKGLKPAGSEISQFNRNLSQSMSMLRLRMNENYTAKWTWEPGDSSLLLPLFPIYKSAYDLLTSNFLQKVKECPSCSWLFLDSTKNRSRKWCDMQSCGSSAKARRYYLRKKKQQRLDS